MTTKFTRTTGILLTLLLVLANNSITSAQSAHVTDRRYVEGRFAAWVEPSFNSILHCTSWPADSYGISLQAYCLSPYQERQHVGYNIEESTPTPGQNAYREGVKAFASANPGKVYFLGDEPDHPTTPVAASEYARLYKIFVDLILGADPTARVSAGGFTVTGTGYAQDFINSYVIQFGTNPRVDEWRFHHFAGLNDVSNMGGWIAHLHTLATWAVAHGAPLVIGSTGFPTVAPGVNVQSAELAMLQAIKDDSRIAAAVWWSYKRFAAGTDADNSHTLVDANWALTSEGQVFRQFIRIPVIYGVGAAPENDIPVPGDYDGDGRTDPAVWRPSVPAYGNTAVFYVLLSSGGSTNLNFGFPTDRPVPGDYDGDGRTDFAVWRSSTGDWFVKYANNSGTIQVNWGWGGYGDVPVPGDYDGDNKTDFAVWRPSDGNWFVKYANNSGSTTTTWGWGGYNDKPVPGDYDGDNKTDFAVWRPGDGNWFVKYANNSGSTTTTWGWGSYNDKPVPGDYNGDGITEIAVWRPSEGSSTAGVWYVQPSSLRVVWGSNNGFNMIDQPVPADYDGDGRTDFAVWRPIDSKTGYGVWNMR